MHGSRAVVAGLVDALSSVVFEGGMVRAAERGEFTRRAFEAGRLDLTEVEGLADLIAAETAMQRRQALRIMGGHVAELLEGWRTEIKTCLAHVEAVIDFGDDVDDDAFEAIVPRVAKLSQRLQSYLYDGHRGEIVRGGARVVIVGEPNAGKSTLLNAFAKRPAAIVSPLAGTTRDVVEVQMDFNGLPVIVSDTAGLRDATDDPIEIEGMRRARNAASIADITILVHDATKGTLDYALKALPSRLNNNSSNAMQRGSTGDSLICVLNKIDLQPSVQSQSTDPNIAIFKTCLLRNEGMAELTTYLENVLRKRLEGQTGEQCGGKSDHDLPIITRARHRHHMAKAVEALECFVEGRTGTDRSIFLPMDMAAENLRIAGKELGAITGIIHVEEVLDVIFSEFCIGK